MNIRQFAEILIDYFLNCLAIIGLSYMETKTADAYYLVVALIFLLLL